MKKVNLFLSINEWCNLDCEYCNVFKTQKKLSFWDCKKAFIYFFKFFQKANGYNVFFIWGEPMLSFLEIKKSVIFLKLLEKKLWKEISISMPSNGTLFKKKHLDFFRLYNVNVSLSIDTLSLDYNYRNIRGKEESSNNILLKQLDLFKRYSDILRIKSVIVPDTINNMKKTFLSLKKEWFKFINMQPAHWIYWSEKNINTYIKNYIYIRDNLVNDHIKSATFKWSECSDRGCTSWCAKWKSEICIDSYWNIMVCDAFLAFSPKKRKLYSHDNLFENNFNIKKFIKYSNWKYCDNDIIWDEKDLTNCNECNETKSCSKLCNALPINWADYDEKILLSNFRLFHKLDRLWM